MPRTPALITLALAIVIGLLTLTPLAELPPPPPGSDKLHHFLAFAALSVPLIAYQPPAALWLLPLTTLYGGLIELTQPHVNRWGEWGDFWADTAGAIAGMCLGLVIFWVRGRIKDNNPNR